jgi:hypothetical protein
LPLFLSVCMSPGGDCCLQHGFWGLCVHVSRWRLSHLSLLVCMSPGGDCRLHHGFWGLCVHVSRWRLSHLSLSACMSPGGDCCLHHSIPGALRTCLQVEIVAFVIVGVHVFRQGLLPSSLSSGGSAYMSPGGDYHVCYCRRACHLQLGTAAFIIVFRGSVYVFLKLSTITSIFCGLSDAFVQTSIKQWLCFFICT